LSKRRAAVALVLVFCFVALLTLPGRDKQTVSAATPGSTTGTSGTAASGIKQSDSDLSGVVMQDSQDSKQTVQDNVKSDDSKTPENGPAIAAKSAILVEQSTGKILYEKNSHEKLPPASITKIMTELLTLEAIEEGKLKWDEKLTCSEHAASMGGSDIWLEPNEQMTVTDLFKAMAISSANDAAVVFAEKIGGSEQGFVNLMNQRAKQLGMNDTHFVNANGLDADGHLTSAYDVMLMSRELLKHKDVFKFCTVWMDSLRGGKTQLVNTNSLIRTYNGINGLKTGSTSKAGYCISATACRDDMQLIAVIMGADNSKDRFKSAANLLDYGFGGWSIVKAQIPQKKFNIKVLNGEEYTVSATVTDLPNVLVEKGKEKSVTHKINIVSDVAAPVEKGQVLGQITIWSDGKNIGTASIKADKAVPKMSFGKAFLRLIGFMAR